MLIWKTCCYGCHHTSTTSHRANITRDNGAFVVLTIWRRGESTHIREVFFRRASRDDGAQAHQHWGCTAPVAAARAWAEKELGG